MPDEQKCDACGAEVQATVYRLCSACHVTHGALAAAVRSRLSPTLRHPGELCGTKLYDEYWNSVAVISKVRIEPIARSYPSQFETGGLRLRIVAYGTWSKDGV